MVWLKNARGIKTASLFLSYLQQYSELGALDSTLSDLPLADPLEKTHLTGLAHYPPGSPATDGGRAKQAHWQSDVKTSWQ